MKAASVPAFTDQSATNLESARANRKAAETEHFSRLLAHQRERYRLAYERCGDSARRDAACGMLAAAAAFEVDGKRIPSRLKKATEIIKIAVFLLDPKAPA